MPSAMEIKGHKCGRSNRVESEDLIKERARLETIWGTFRVTISVQQNPQRGEVSTQSSKQREKKRSEAERTVIKAASG